MIDRNQFLSRDWRNDDYTQWFFVRDTKLPVGYFDVGLTADHAVLIAIAIIAVALVAMAIVGWV